MREKGSGELDTFLGFVGRGVYLVFSGLYVMMPFNSCRQNFTLYHNIMTLTDLHSDWRVPTLFQG